MDNAVAFERDSPPPETGINGVSPDVTIINNIHESEAIGWGQDSIGKVEVPREVPKPTSSPKELPSRSPSESATHGIRPPTEPSPWLVPPPPPGHRLPVRIPTTQN